MASGSHPQFVISTMKQNVSFKPTFAEDLFDKDKVKSLRVICASTIRRFGDQIKLDELPYECQILVKYLPKLLTPSSKEKNEAEALSTNNNSDNLADNGLLPRKRVLPSWMKQPTSELENRMNVTTVAEEGKYQTVVRTLWISRLDFFNFQTY